MKNRPPSKKEKRRRKYIKHAMKSTWSSLKSHLGWAYTEERNKKLGKKNRKFDIKCVREYVDTMKLLSKLY